jgi:L-amino acid N-acyltransferase YncA
MYSSIPLQQQQQSFHFASRSWLYGRDSFLCCQILASPAADDVVKWFAAWVAMRSQEALQWTVNLAVKIVANIEAVSA